MAGVTANGLITLSLAELLALLDGDLAAAFGASFDRAPQSVAGQLSGVMADRFADLWALAAAIDTQFNPDSAIGTALDNLCAITGTVRNPATYSKLAALILTGNNGTVVPLGSVASVAGIGTRFVTDGPGGVAATLATATAWVDNTFYPGGTIRRNGSTQRIYLCVVPGISGVVGPTTTGANIQDGSAQWTFLGTGAAYTLATATCNVTGPKVGAAFTVTVIETPVSGWLSASNVLDAHEGMDLETDAALRLRREAELRGGGKASVESIRAALLEVADVSAATVFENVNDDVDGDGLLGHSIECLVLGGTDAAIRAAIFSEIAAGIAARGTTTGTVTDTQGIVHEIDFTRPTLEPVYIGVTVSADVSLWPSDGITQLKQLIVDWGNLQRAGKDVVASAIEAQTFELPGALDAVALISLAPAPTLRNTISITPRQLATYDTSRIAVVVNFVTP